jgi:hypothetical protein
MESASKLLAINDFVQLLTDVASNLPWRLVGCENWTPGEYLNLFREGLENRAWRNAFTANIAYVDGIVLILKQRRSDHH